MSNKPLKKTKKKSLKSLFKKIPTIQLSMDDRILARRYYLVMTNTTPYPPFNQEYIFENDLKNLKIRLKKEAAEERLKEKKKEKKAKEVARKAKTKAKETLKKQKLKTVKK